MDNWTRIAALVVENLPQDIDQRLATMESLTALIPDKHPHTPQILEMARDLCAHVNSQKELRLQCNSTPATRGSARLTDKRVPR